MEWVGSIFHSRDLQKEWKKANEEKGVILKMNFISLVRVKKQVLLSVGKPISSIWCCKLAFAISVIALGTSVCSLHPFSLIQQKKNKKKTKKTQILFCLKIAQQ